MFVRRGLYQFNRSINELFLQSSLEARDGDTYQVKNLCQTALVLVAAFGRKADYKMATEEEQGAEVNKYGDQITKATQDAILSLLAALIHRLREGKKTCETTEAQEESDRLDFIPIQDLLVDLRDMVYASLEVDITNELQNCFEDPYILEPVKKQSKPAQVAQGGLVNLDALAGVEGSNNNEIQASSANPSLAGGQTDAASLPTPEEREIAFQDAAYKVLHSNAYLTPQTKKIMAASAMVLLGVALIGIVAVSHGGGLETIAQAYGHFGKHLGMALSGELTHHQVAAEEAAGMLVSGSAVAAGLRYGTSANPEVAVVQNVRADRLAYEMKKMQSQASSQSSQDDDSLAPSTFPGNA